MNLKRRIIQLLRPSTADLKALLAKRLPAPGSVHHSNDIKVNTLLAGTHAMLELHHAQQRQAAALRILG